MVSEAQPGVIATSMSGEVAALEQRVSDLEQILLSRDGSSDGACLYIDIQRVCEKALEAGLDDEALKAMQRAQALQRHFATPAQKLPANVNARVNNYCASVREVEVLAPVLDKNCMSATSRNPKMLEELLKARIATDRARAAIDAETRVVTKLVVEYNDAIACLNSRIKSLAEMVRTLERRQSTSDTDTKTGAQ